MLSSDSAREAFLLRMQLHDDGVECEPEHSFAQASGFELVGNGSPTNEFCGTFWYFRGCIDVGSHNHIDVSTGVNYSGKAYVECVHHYCDKPSCPICYKSGWAVRQAGKIEARLVEAKKRFGLAEHIVCSVPVRDYGLGFDSLRAKAIKILASRGVHGGCLIYHHFRYKEGHGWFVSPHFHVLGFVSGGYRCRECVRKWNCLAGCGGFDDVNYHLGLKDGWKVKVLGKRKTIFGTAWYQLNHSSIRRGGLRTHACFWFGVCSYRRLKVVIVKVKRLCPICEGELKRLLYIGSEFIPRFRSDSGYCASFLADMYSSDGRGLNWCLSHSGNSE